MNFVANDTGVKAGTGLDLDLFYEAVFRSEFAVYVIHFDDHGIARFEDANETVLGMAGRSRAEIVGQRPIECLPAEIGNCLETQLNVCFASALPHAYERLFEGPNGPIAFKTSLVPIAGRFGRVEHVVGITR